MGNWDTSTPSAEPKSFDCGTFYPAIERLTFYKVYRIPADIPVDTVDVYLIQAIIRVKRALADWMAEQVALEYNSLAEVPQETVDGVGELSLLWERAVFCEAKAEILKETETVERRAAAENAAKSGEETEDKYREFAQDAIRTIVGMGRVSIELI